MTVVLGTIQLRLAVEAEVKYEFSPDFEILVEEAALEDRWTEPYAGWLWHSDFSLDLIVTGLWMYF